MFFWLLGLIGLVLDVIVFGALAYVVIRNRWYVQALLVVGFVGAMGCSVAGILFLTDNKDTNDTAGAVLVVGGIALLLGTAATWFFLRGPKSG